MSSELKRVLVVDDEPLILDLLSEFLKSDYEIAVASNGKEGIELGKSFKPHLAIIDVNLGDMDGRQVCRSIKSLFPEDTLSTLFISADSDETTILECFDSGGDDYLVKPFSPSHLKLKIGNIINEYEQINELKKEKSELSSLIGSTMTQASSYGALLNLVKKLNYCNSEQEIADCTFNYLSSQGIKSAIYLTNSGAQFCFDSQGTVCSPILKEVFELTHNRKRLFSTQSKIIASDKHVSILFKNPPDEGTEEYGIFIDIIAVLIEALEARYISFLREKELSVMHKELTEVITELSDGVNTIQAKKQKLIDDIVLQVSLSFHQLDLSEEQENYFNQMLEHKVMKTDDTNIMLPSIQNRLSKLVVDMNDLVMPSKKLKQIDDEDVQLF